MMKGITNVGDVVAAVSASSLLVTANTLGTNNKYLSKALRSLGYQAVQGKGWQYAGEGEAPDEMPVEEFLALCKKSTSVTKVSKSNTNMSVVTEGNMSITPVTSSNNLQVATTLFTENDVSDLLTMLSEWRANKGNTNVIEVTETIFDRLQMLPKNPSTRKTYVIDEEIAAAFDEYCTKKNINKSHALTIALQDFLAKF